MLKAKRVVITGGSRGLGLGVVESLVEQGATVTVVARGAADLRTIRAQLGVDIVVGDVTQASVADQVVTRIKPEVLILNAGSIPPMGPLHELTWDDFSAPWNIDVKAGLIWLQAAIRAPLPPGSRVLLGSSGAAQNGSPLSGGYA